MGHTPRRDPHPQGDLGHGATLPNANCQVGEGDGTRDHSRPGTTMQAAPPRGGLGTPLHGLPVHKALSTHGPPLTPLHLVTL